MIPPHPVSESVLTVRRLTIVLALAFPSVLAAQDSIPPADSTQFEVPADSTAPAVDVERDSLGRPIIRYVEVRRSDIFDSTEARSWLPRLVNGLHVMTLPGIISRELLLKVGDPYDSAQVAETARNLRTLGIFRTVTIDSATTDSGFALKVFAQDGWTTQADLRFRSAGSQTDYQISLIERNLIGTATRFAVRYRHTPDRDIFAVQFLQPRLLVRTVSLGLRYESRSDGTRAAIAVDRPFFSLSDRAGLQTLFDIRNERVLQFRNGLADPSDSLRRRFVIGRVVAAKALRASSQGYVRIGLSAQVRREDYTIWPVQPAGRTVTATVGPFIEWRRANFVVTRGFARQGREEDVDLSNLARLEVLAAPEFLGYDTGGVGLLAQVRVGTKLPQGFAWIDSRANGVFNGGGLDSGSVTIGGTFVVAPMRRHLLVGHADIGWIRNPLPATEFDLGFALGPRAFPIHAFTGDRTYFTTAEYRYTIGEDLFKALDLGLAGFVDHGGAWYRTQPRRTGTDVGLGIRLSPSRAADANTTRLDLAYRFKNDQERAGWVFVVASGLVFNSNPR